MAFLRFFYVKKDISSVSGIGKWVGKTGTNNKNRQNTTHAVWGLRPNVLRFWPCVWEPALTQSRTPVRFGFKLSQHGGKNNKNRLEAKRRNSESRSKLVWEVLKRICFLGRRPMFLPLLMSSIAKQWVLMAGLVWELAHRHKAVTSAHRRKARRH